MSESYPGREPGAEHDSIQAAAEQVAGVPLAEMQTNPPHKMYKDEGETKVFKALISNEPESLLEDTRRQVEIISELRQSNAKLLGFEEPRLVNNVVVVPAPFLPNELPKTPEGYGKFGTALASLHKAGHNLRSHEGLKPYDPLPEIWGCYEQLQELNNEGRPFSMDNVTFPSDTLPVLHDRLIEAQEAYESMPELAKRKNLRPTTLLLDVHAGNVLLDEHEEPAIIDTLGEMYVGWPEIDLARPTAHWSGHFKRDKRLLRTFRESYEASADYEVDEEMLDLAKKVADMYYGVAMLKNAVNSYKLGHPVHGQAWRITEVVNRVHGLYDPEHEWKSQVDYQQQ